VVDMARGGVVSPPEFREDVVDIFKNFDRQEEIEKAFEEKALSAPQRRVEYRPLKPPQGLPGFASELNRQVKMQIKDTNQET
jgi:hypothetical protein